jgi:hypothetical protein
MSKTVQIHRVPDALHCKLKARAADSGQTLSDAYFFNRATGLRIDLLFDFPVAASTLLEGAMRKRVRSQVFRIASEEDLLRLKRIAAADRRRPSDTEDIAFLEARRTS